ncbi:MAG: hypothetical protein PQJ59_08445 [Spirochaetales bacterium]|nr:hypothetical protein [Spirochaetales bacterium]
MKKIGLLLAVLAILCMTACNGTSDDAALKTASSLKINFCHGNNSRTMTYQKAVPLNLPDGTTVSQGDLKPTWQYISRQVGFEIQDVAVQDQKASEMVDICASTGFDNAVIFGGNSIAEDLMNYGAEGFFINLLDHLDEMPDVAQFLEDNPNVAKAITAYDGGIYHLPYVAEIDNYARVFFCRGDWVTSMLDSTDALEAEDRTLNVAYEGYWERSATNVIDLQNAAAKGGVLDRDTALATLIKYINDTYDYAKPSELYLGEGALYDIDELIALWRVMKLSPNTLSKVSTGEVIPGTEISPYFFRKTSYRDEIFKLANYFDGVRVHGSDSYKARFYDDGQNNVVYSYASEEFLSKVDYLKQIYSEGLIYSEFTDTSYKDLIRKTMFFSDDIDGVKQFGFMTYDWIVSTTSGSNKIIGMLPPLTTLSQAGINDFVHYVENTRAIKPDGWSISAKASEEEIHAALKLFNYLFTEEGRHAQIYSIPATRVAGESFIGPDGQAYPKFSQWLFDAAREYKNNDLGGFMRDFMGSLLAVGYQKEMGMELQYTNENGTATWKLYNENEVLSPSYSSENAYLRMMPPVFSLTGQDLAKLTTVAVGDDQTDALFKYITGSDENIKSVDDIAKLYEEGGIDLYESIYQGAYDRILGK